MGASKCLTWVFSNNEKLLHLIHLNEEMKTNDDFSNIYSSKISDPMILVDDKKSTVIQDLVNLYGVKNEK